VTEIMIRNEKYANMTIVFDEAFIKAERTPQDAEKFEVLKTKVARFNNKNKTDPDPDDSMLFKAH
jgi:hypothetical protein